MSGLGCLCLVVSASLLLARVSPLSWPRQLATHTNTTSTILGLTNIAGTLYHLDISYLVIQRVVGYLQLCHMAFVTFVKQGFKAAGEFKIIMILFVIIELQLCVLVQKAWL